MYPNEIVNTSNNVGVAMCAGNSVKKEKCELEEISEILYQVQTCFNDLEIKCGYFLRDKQVETIGEEELPDENTSEYQNRVKDIKTRMLRLKWNIFDMQSRVTK